MDYAKVQAEIAAGKQPTAAALDAVLVQLLEHGAQLERETQGWQQTAAGFERQAKADREALRVRDDAIARIDNRSDALRVQVEEWKKTAQDAERRVHHLVGDAVTLQQRIDSLVVAVMDHNSRTLRLRRHAEKLERTLRRRGIGFRPLAE